MNEQTHNSMPEYPHSYMEPPGFLFYDIRKCFQHCLLLNVKVVCVQQEKLLFITYVITENSVILTSPCRRKVRWSFAVLSPSLSLTFQVSGSPKVPKWIKNDIKHPPSAHSPSLALCLAATVKISAFKRMQIIYFQLDFQSKCLCRTGLRLTCCVE